jgi:hypothetical protein
MRELLQQLLPRVGLGSDAAAVAAMMPKGSLQATGVSFRSNLHGDSPSGVSLSAVDSSSTSGSF